MTTAKLLGLGTVIVVGFLCHDPAAAAPAPPDETTRYNLGLALILVVFTYGGWNDIAYAAAEVRDPQLNICAPLCSACWPWRRSTSA